MTADLYALCWVATGALLGQHFVPGSPLSCRIGWMILWPGCLIVLCVMAAMGGEKGREDGHE